MNLVAVLSGCTPTEPPGVRQLLCRQTGGGAAPDSAPMIVQIDTGRHVVRWINGPGAVEARLTGSPYRYVFSPRPVGGTWLGIAIDRYDGSMALRRTVATSGGRSIQQAVERWSCARVPVGPKL